MIFRVKTKIPTEQEKDWNHPKIYRYRIVTFVTEILLFSEKEQNSIVLNLFHEIICCYWVALLDWFHSIKYLIELCWFQFCSVLVMYVCLLIRYYQTRLYYTILALIYGRYILHLRNCTQHSDVIHRLMISARLILDGLKQKGIRVVFTSFDRPENLLNGKTTC